MDKMEDGTWGFNFEVIKGKHAFVCSKMDAK
jgi:hypothetical protein